MVVSFQSVVEMAISQEGGVVVSWWLRANRWDKNLLEEEGGGGKATIASVSRIQRRNHIQNQTEGKGVLPAWSVPYHALCRYLANTRIQISNLHTLLPRSFFFFLSFFLEFLFFSNRARQILLLEFFCVYIEPRIFATLKNKNSGIKFSWEQFLIKSKSNECFDVEFGKVSFDSERWYILGQKREIFG